MYRNGKFKLPQISFFRLRKLRTFVVMVTPRFFIKKPLSPQTLLIHPVILNLVK
jgi:hypothetical protein